MSLLFKGKTGEFEQRWIVYALLRDNIQHHLEGNSPTAVMGTIHRVTEALGGGTVRLEARALHREISDARKALAKMPFAKLAISVRTLAVVSLTWPPPDSNETMLLENQGKRMPFLDLHGETLQDVFGILMDELLRITKGASVDDVVEVTDL